MHTLLNTWFKIKSKYPTQALALSLALKGCAVIEERVKSYTDFVFPSVQ